MEIYEITVGGVVDVAMIMNESSKLDFVGYTVEQVGIGATVVEAY
jgi:hypothetical protein